MAECREANGRRQPTIPDLAARAADAGYRGAARLLRGRRPVAAIAAVNDLAAVGALAAAEDAGLDVPGGLAVTGYDDTFIAGIRQVSLTSVNPNGPGVGSLAAHCLLHQIEDPERPVGEHLLSPRLVTRYSSSAPIVRRGLSATGPTEHF